MDNKQFSTVGREFYPNYELKICCLRDLDYLGGEGITDRFRIVYVKEGYGVFRNWANSQLITSPTVLCLNETDQAEICNAVGLKLDIMIFEPSSFELYVTFPDLETWKNTLSNDYWFFRPFFKRSESYIGACPTNYYHGNRVFQLIERTDREITEQKDLSWPCRGRSFYIELLLLVNSIYDEGNGFENSYCGVMTDEIREVINWLHIHYLCKITIEMVTKQFHTNKTTLNQKFKAVIGMTVMEYVGSLRMQIACSFLRKTYLPINEIMERSGYRDDAYFLRAFRKYNGCTPKEYRNQFTIPE